MVAKRIESQDDLKHVIDERSESVTTFLCENVSDIELLEENLKTLSIEFDLFCPIDPYNHDPCIINNFFEKVDSQRKGIIEFHSQDS